MKLLILLSAFLFSLLLPQLNAQNAPITIAPEITCDPGTTVDMPITVSNFNNIRALSLTLLFDETALTYQSFTNNSNFPGLIAFEGIPGRIITAGFVQPEDPGLSLPDSSVLFTLTFYCIEGFSGLDWFDDGESCEYANDQNIPLIDTPTCLYYINGSVNESSLQIELKMYLEGAFQNGEMTTELNDLGLIPTAQPYSGTPWIYDGCESVSSIPENVVDWVLVELRESTGDASTATNDKVVARQAGFLMKNGYIKDTDATVDLGFSVPLNNNLYVVVYHRNHVAVISANPIIIFNGNGIYDFSSEESKVLGGSLGHKELSGGIWGLAAGDSNGDGNIDGLDKQEWDQYVGTWGYLPSDFSFDSQIDNMDKNDFWKLNFGFISRVP